MPDAFYLLSGGTVELTRGNGVARQVVLRASPGDIIGMISLIMGTPLSTTATALTPVTTYKLDKECIAAVLRLHPTLAGTLEAQAKHGRAWLMSAVDAQEHGETPEPQLVLHRLREFLHRLNA